MPAGRLCAFLEGERNFKRQNIYLPSENISTIYYFNVVFYHIFVLQTLALLVLPYLLITTPSLCYLNACIVSQLNLLLGNYCYSVNIDE